MIWHPINSPAPSLASCRQCRHWGPFSGLQIVVMLSYIQVLAHLIPWIFGYHLFPLHNATWDLLSSWSLPAFPKIGWIEWLWCSPSQHLLLSSVTVFIYLYPLHVVSPMRLASASINICWINDNYSGLPWLNLEWTTWDSHYKTDFLMTDHL